MSTYAANITGSDAYWYKRRAELEATFEQKEAATVFFTFSYADNHWHDLHRLMPRNFNKTQSELDFSHKYSDVLSNPHLVDWYFSQRLEVFLNIVFDDILKCKWRWHR